MSKYKVIQFPDNTYGVMKKTFFGRKMYARNYKTHYPISSNDIHEIYRYGRHENYEQALETANWMNREFKEIL